MLNTLSLRTSTDAGGAAGMVTVYCANVLFAYVIYTLFYMGPYINIGEYK
jgi:hypothetical protein